MFNTWIHSFVLINILMKMCCISCYHCLVCVGYLPDIRQNLSRKLTIMTIALTRIICWVLYMLSSLVCFDYCIHVDCSWRSCACLVVLCVHNRVDIPPIRLGTHSHTSNTINHHAHKLHYSKAKQINLLHWQERAKTNV